MSSDDQLIEDMKRQILAKYPRFGSDIAVMKIEFKDDLPYHSAATDGKIIYFDPDFFKSLSEDERTFVIAHEIMHIKFMHMFRLTDKSGKKRDMQVWNIATDAIINANLKRDGLKMREGYVDKPEALQYTAEEYYDILMKQQEQNNANGQGQSDTNGQEQGDDHSMWEKAFEDMKQEQSQQGQTKKDKTKQDEEQQSEIDEQEEFNENRREKITKFKQYKKQQEQHIRSGQQATKEIGDIGESAKSINWEQRLQKRLEKTKTIWSKRRSVAENNYAYRLLDRDAEDERETEVMIDVSGSVDINLVKAFLRHVKKILEYSRVRVGCFDYKFWDFIEIRSASDIDKFRLPEDSGGGTDLDLPVRKFSKNPEIQKIIFTDGYGIMPESDLKNVDVTWVIYGNDDFNPCCGEVIYIPDEQLEQLSLESNDENKDR